jgi:hypothetical protein
MKNASIKGQFSEGMDDYSVGRFVEIRGVLEMDWRQQ